MDVEFDDFYTDNHDIRSPMRAINDLFITEEGAVDAVEVTLHAIARLSAMYESV